MSAKILDGKVLAQKLLAELKAEVAALKVQTGKVPRFMNIVVGQDESANSYAKSQVRAAEIIGIDYQFSHLPQHATRRELHDQIKLLNDDPEVHGVMIHKPVPDEINFQKAVNLIHPQKDLEGINEVNFGQLLLGRAKIVPCTPGAVMALIESTGVDIAGKDAIVVGRSEIVGKPVALLLLEKNASVTVCHSGTSKAGRLADHVKRADVLVVAVGRPGFVKGEWVKEGAIVIDVGINSINGKLTGDVEFDAAAKRASFITPVPGGVGPVTSVMLMKNGIETFKQQLKIS
jgi:methylenetetrahydrofolate dehydrogenase (NADP+) / methenyltetrahydrofolate cyclohydrolase